MTKDTIYTDSQLQKIYATKAHTTLGLGGKVHGLLELLEAKVTVPPFFVLLADQEIDLAMQYFQQLQKTDAQRWKRVAVRSSAMTEDGVEHSFAGMYESILGVDTSDALQRAITTCRDSVNSQRITEYRTMHNLEKTSVTVIIQEMIEGECSGVLFSSDPVAPDEVLISVGLGIGEGVVQGLVPCDTHRVTENNEVHTIVAKKDIGMYLDGDGQSVEKQVDAIRQQVAALSSEQVVRLAKQSRELATKIGYALDIEWTMLENQFYFLQARPITQKMPNGRKLLWDNSNIVESYCGITLPLTYSFACHAYTIVYQLFCRVMGVSDATIREHSTLFPRMIGLIRGHIFYNLNAWYTIVSLLPGYQWNRAFLEKMMGVSEVAGQSDAAAVSGNWLVVRLRVLWLMVVLMWRAFRLDSDVRWFHAVVHDALSLHSREALQKKDAFQLLETYADLERKLLWSWHVPIVNDFFVMIAHGLLQALSKKFLPDQPDIHNALLSGEGGMISAEPALRVEEIVKQVLVYPSLMQEFEKYSKKEISLSTLREKMPSSVQQSIDRYIQDFGDRCADELKLETETLVHNPEPLYQNLATSLHRRSKPMHFTDTPMRKRAEEIVEKELSGWKKMLFTRIVQWARKRVQARENLRFERTRVFSRVREVFRAMATILVSYGQLKDPKDIFYLQVQEIWGWVQGNTVSMQLQTLVDQRKEQYAMWEKQGKPANRFYTYGPVWQNNHFVGKQQVSSQNTKNLVGVPACPGLVEGVAKVIKDPTTETLAFGEILVCYRTDPGWAPLFPNAAAILVERGSLLSHSAVVARELGIPTIVAIPNLVERVQTGMRLKVRAGDGIAEFVDTVETKM